MKEYKLSVDPSILELLGPSLYTNIYYVLAELVANAYDADASNVYIISNKDDIRVEDDGHGMSYKDGEIDKYLNVASVSRKTEKDSMTRSGDRRKMGRKGVGKLAALSVSENVDVLTVSNGEKSGFVLSRRPGDGNELKPIAEEEIQFERVKDHGTAVVMRHPQYRLHKTIAAVKRNLLKIFPLVDSAFKIHIIRDGQAELIDDFDKNIVGQLSTLITLGEIYSPLCELVPDYFPAKRGDLVVAREPKAIPLTMADTQGDQHEYILKIEGWIGTYKTTKGRKSEMTDFPDNFISLFANKKMGEFNILPVVGQNKLNEVYVVGQLHVDLFELTELPDMALSNRQGYKSDDQRYEALLDYVQKELLSDILRMREKFTDLTKKEKKMAKETSMRENEEKLRKAMDGFRWKASAGAAKAIVALGAGAGQDAIESAVSRAISDNNPDLGLKAIVDSQKKRILISQTRKDKDLADIVFQMLIYNGVSADDIIYTNCDDDVCHVPEGADIYKHLREFFVDSYSAQKIYVLFVTSENTVGSWGAVAEVGAAWITKANHKIFNIPPFKPERPLNDAVQWHNTKREPAPDLSLSMDKLNAGIFCRKIEAVCDELAYRKKHAKKI